MAVKVPKKALWKAIRGKCINCCCFQPGVVRDCGVPKCELYPYRFGRSCKPHEDGYQYFPSNVKNELRNDVFSVQNDPAIPT